MLFRSWQPSSARLARKGENRGGTPRGTTRTTTRLVAQPSRLRGSSDAQVAGLVPVKVGREKTVGGSPARVAADAARPWRRARSRRDRVPATPATTDSHGDQSPEGERGACREARGSTNVTRGTGPATATDPCEGKPLKTTQNPVDVSGWEPRSGRRRSKPLRPWKRRERRRGRRWQAGR